MRFITPFICLALATLITCVQVAAQERTDVELVFLADASGSIDDAEIVFQRQGYATVITDPQILSVIRGGAPRGRFRRMRDRSSSVWLARLETPSATWKTTPRRGI